MNNHPIVYWYQRLKRECFTYYYVLKDPNTPAHLKILPLMVFIAYLVIPFDLIPDLIPFLGYVDDGILLMLGMGLLTRLLPSDIITRCRQKAEEKLQSSYVLEWILLSIVLIMIAIGITISVLLYQLFFS